MGQNGGEETQFLMENREELEREFGGKFIAVYRGEIVASGETVAEVYRITNEKNIELPLVTYVPGEGEEDHLL